MAAIGTLPVLFGTGIHASRPAASAVGKGGLYSCTTHSLVYQTDGSSWTTWATLGATASGSITASGYTQSTAKMLGRSTASTGAIEEITVGSGLSLSAGSLTATGGAGFTHSYVGYNTVGGTTEAVTSNRTYLKKITVASAGVLQSIGVHIKQTVAGAAVAFAVGVVDDVGGTPTHLLSTTSGQDASAFLSTANGVAGDARWVHLPVGLYLAAADYWLTVWIKATGHQVYKDGSGSDRYFLSDASRVTDVGWASVTTTTDKYSIRGSFIA